MDLIKKSSTALIGMLNNPEIVEDVKREAADILNRRRKLPAKFAHLVEDFWGGDEVVTQPTTVKVEVEDDPKKGTREPKVKRVRFVAENPREIKVDDYVRFRDRAGNEHVGIVLGFQPGSKEEQRFARIKCTDGRIRVKRDYAVILIEDYDGPPIKKYEGRGRKPKAAIQEAEMDNTANEVAVLEEEE